MKATEHLSEQELLVELLKEVKEIKQSLKDSSKAPALDFVDNADLMRLLKINVKTLSNWRKKKLISYHKLGGKIYYSLEEIKKVLQR